MQIDEVEKNLIRVVLELRLKEEKEVETKKQMNREEFYTWTQNFEAKFFGQFSDFNQRLSIIEQRLDKIEKRLDKVEARLDVLEKDVKDIKNRLTRIESCPTIKKELELLNN